MVTLGRKPYPGWPQAGNGIFDPKPAAEAAATASSKIRASLEGGIFLSARIARMARMATLPKSSHVVRSIRTVVTVS